MTREFDSCQGITGLPRGAEERLRESEANFRTFFETMTDMIMVGTSTGSILYANPAVSRTLGYSAAELAGMHILDLHPPDVREEAHAILAAMLRRERESCPLPLARKDGRLVPVETRVWFGQWNGTECIFGICKNLSAVEEARQRFERLFRNSPVLMALSTLPDRKFFDVNDCFLKTLGYTRAEVVGRTSADLGLFVSAEQQAAAAERLLAEGRVVDLELQARAKDGTIRDGLFSGELISSQGREYLLTVMVDITDRKRAEEALAHERRRLDGIIRGTNAGTWEWNVQTGEVAFNERWAEIIGYTLDELSPTTIATWAALAHPDDLQQSNALLEQHFRGESDYYEFESRMRHKDGDWVWVLDRGKVASWTADGRPQMMLGTHQEITRRKRTEAELARLSVLQRELMCLATEFVNVPLERQDEAIERSLATMGQLIRADRAYLFSYDFHQRRMSNTHEWCAAGITAEKDNLQGIPLDAFPLWTDTHCRGELMSVPSVAALPADSPLRQALEPQGIQSLITLPLMQKSVCLGFVGFDAVREQRIWQESEVALLRVLAELYAHFEARRGWEREMRELQQRLTLARDAAQEAALAKSLFLANMSHEIRTPLNAILGYAQIMEHECRTCPNGNRLTAITRSGEHLLTLITDLLDQVRRDTGAVTLAPRVFDFPQTLEDVRLMFARRPGAAQVTLQASCGPDVPRCIWADEGKVRQVLVNLVGNALKFTSKGWVRMTASRVPGGTPEGILLAVDVEDTGCGIREDERDGIFELFAQTESGRKTGKGTGLGLPLSRRYARALGGDLVLVSHTGAGTCFRFTFVAQPARGKDAPAIRGRVERLASDQPAPHVLVVDDDPASRHMLATLLTSVGFATKMAASAPQALELLRSDVSYDVVLMDKRMPEMDGLEALGRIRDLPGGRDLAVLIVSASSLGDESDAALAAGADGYVAKPVRREQLLAEIGRIAGVRYEHEAGSSCGPEAAELAPLEPAEPARLSAEQCQVLDKALRRGDIRQLRDMVEMLAREQAGLAAQLRVLVEAFDYDGLRRLLDAATETAGQDSDLPAHHIARQEPQA